LISPKRPYFPSPTGWLELPLSFRYCPFTETRLVFFFHRLSALFNVFKLPRRFPFPACLGLHSHDFRLLSCPFLLALMSNVSGLASGRSQFPVPLSPYPPARAREVLLFFSLDFIIFRFCASLEFWPRERLSDEASGVPVHPTNSSFPPDAGGSLRFFFFSLGRESPPLPSY